MSVKASKFPEIVPCHRHKFETGERCAMLITYFNSLFMKYSVQVTKKIASLTFISTNFLPCLFAERISAQLINYAWTVMW